MLSVRDCILPIAPKLSQHYFVGHFAQIVLCQHNSILEKTTLSNYDQFCILGLNIAVVKRPEDCGSDGSKMEYQANVSNKFARNDDGLAWAQFNRIFLKAGYSKVTVRKY
jgi:hypothetical protein